MSWNDFEKDCPDLASLGFELLNRKIAYLALLDEGGSPRIHPITPFIGNGMLFMFTEPSSPKIRDLQRDGRYALHCSVGGDDRLREFLVTGYAVVISDKEIRNQAVRIASSPVVLDIYVLFEFQITRVLVVDYDEEKNRTIHRW